MTEIEMIGNSSTKLAFRSDDSQSTNKEYKTQNQKK